MIITYYGAYCIKAQSGEKILAFNPPSKKSSFKSPRFQADIVLISQKDKDFNGFENISAKKEGAPFLIDGPGEYEIGGILIDGLPALSGAIYVLNWENIRLCHLGPFDGKELKTDILEKIGEIDVLFVSAKTPINLINQINPRVFIPLYRDSKELKEFFKKISKGQPKPIDKFSFKKKDLAGKDEEMIILKPVI